MKQMAVRPLVILPTGPLYASDLRPFGRAWALLLLVVTLVMLGLSVVDPVAMP